MPGVSNGENRTIDSVDQLASTYAALFERLKSEGWDHSELIDEDIDSQRYPGDGADSLPPGGSERRRFRRTGGNVKVMLFDGEWKITTQADILQVRRVIRN